MENFPLAGRPVHPALIHAYGAVKLACRAHQPRTGLRGTTPTFAAIEAACQEMIDGRARRARRRRCPAGRRRHFDQHERQRGAGQPGPATARPAAGRLRTTVSPHDDINLHQSTNDTYPTALQGGRHSSACASWSARSSRCWRRSSEKEKEFADVVKIGRTELQDAVLTTLGREMAAYAEAFARDRWRIYKCEERLRVVNLGGTAIGTGLGAPRQYIFRVVEHLRRDHRPGPGPGGEPGRGHAERRRLRRGQRHPPHAGRRTC